MGQIIAFGQTRKTKEPSDTQEQKEPRYCCTRCDSELFNLLETGLVKCSQCGSVMKNLGALPIDLTQRS